LIPVITDADIRRVQDEFGTPYDFSGHERVAILKCTESKDVNACAGSGKTTLLVAKLGILVRKWTHTHRGIAVLSHTNAARRVVEKNLAKIATHQLTAYPHFVGTIQSFVDKFLATPACVEYFGQRPTPDDDRLCRILRGVYGRRQTELSAAANHVRRRREKDALFEEKFFRKLQYHYEDGALWLPIVRKSRGGRAYYKTSSDTYRQFEAVKREAQDAGVWGYRDMFALAEKYVTEYPRIGELLRWRFPLVLIDEMQDTSAGQWRLLDLLFGSSTTVQRFGDPNQAILDDDFEAEDESCGAEFPRTDHLTLSQSLRFGCSIARLVKGVAVETMDIVGCEHRRDDLPHTVFLFDRSSIGGVLAEFASLVLRCYSDRDLDVPDNRVVAIGAVQRRPPVGHDAFPYSVHDYWDEFTPKESRPAARLACLSDYVLAGNEELLADGDCNHVLLRMMDGLAEALRRNRTKHPTSGKFFSATSLRDYLCETQRGKFLVMKRDMYKRCRVADHATVNVERLRSWARDLLVPLVADHWTAEANAYLDGQPCGAAQIRATSHPTSGSSNSFIYREDTRSVSVDLGTVHSEKGYTHLATLVLQTQFQKPDIPNVLDWIVGAPEEKPKGWEIRHLQRIHVAMTRPRELLCLAICKDTLPTGFDVNALTCRGWLVNDLTM
jgi:hypothetical protein